MFGLWGEADVAQDRDPSLDQKGHCFHHVWVAPLQLHPIHPCLLHQTSCREEGLLFADLVAQERQVGHQKGSFYAAAHCLGVVDHLFQSQGQGAAVP